ncbi:MAG TPA: SusD family outer membrane lipoprotein NanU [Chitinophagaceae bacterium]|nr:SusD family outer membrane lipoprotein NanU [Chitinophagaceae bacterium]
MKKIFNFILLSIGIITFTGSCSKKLDLAPVSSITDANFWKTADQFDAFVSGIHSRFRSHTSSFQALGELRSDIFGTEPGSAGTFSGEATQGLERFWQQTLTLDAAGVSNFGGFYSNIVQLNLLIDKLNNTTVVTTTNKNYYLGLAYGMRAYYYFQLTRAWGDVVIQTDPVTSINVSELAKPASPAAEVMTLIKSDIENSLTNYGADYSFKNTKSYWSKAATQMLKAEVFLWTAHRGGGTADATTALNALTDIQTNIPALALQLNFANVFASTNKGNNEIIFAVRFGLNESSLPFAGTFYPQTALLANYYDSLGNRKFNVTQDNWNGLLRAPIPVSTFRKFNNLDTRKWFSIQPVYNSPAPGVYVIVGSFVKKYEGEQNQGSRVYTNDFPIYRYADLLLLKAEAKVILGQSPATEINLVRARGYGSNYVSALHGFPNQAIDTDPKQAILQERFFEFIFEGKRWLDLRRFGDSYVFQHTAVLSSEAYKVLWPIDRNSLTNNRGLVQTPGYPSF